MFAKLHTVPNKNSNKHNNEQTQHKKSFLLGVCMSPWPTNVSSLLGFICVWKCLQANFAYGLVSRSFAGNGVHRTSLLRIHTIRQRLFILLTLISS